MSILTNLLEAIVGSTPTPNNSSNDSLVPQRLKDPKDYSKKSIISSDNPIRKKFEIQSEGFSLPKELAFPLVEKVITKTKEILEKNPDLKPEEKLMTVRKILVNEGVTFNSNTASVYTESVSYTLGRRFTLDCDTGTDILMAVAHEFKWPLSSTVMRSIYMPHHMAAIWDDGKNFFYFDINMGGEVYYTNQFYINDYNIHPEPVKNGVYLSKFGLECELANSYMVRGVAVHYANGQIQSTLKDLNTATSLCPNFVVAHEKIAIIQYLNNNLEEAKKAWAEAVNLDPDTVISRLSEAANALENKNYEGAHVLSKMLLDLHSDKINMPSFEMQMDYSELLTLATEIYSATDPESVAKYVAYTKNPIRYAIKAILGL